MVLVLGSAYKAAIRRKPITTICFPYHHLCTFVLRPVSKPDLPLSFILCLRRMFNLAMKNWKLNRKANWLWKRNIKTSNRVPQTQQSKALVRQMEGSQHGFKLLEPSFFSSILGKHHPTHDMIEKWRLTSSRGVTAMFGVFQTYYQTNLLKSKSPSDISWIGSTQGFLLLFGGAVTGPFFDLGYLRTLLIIGTFCSVVGMMLTSICKDYWQFFLAQGIIMGIGFGCLFLPSIAIISQYFTTRKSTAFGVAASGSSIGKSLLNVSHPSNPTSHSIQPTKLPWCLNNHKILSLTCLTDSYLLHL